MLQLRHAGVQALPLRNAQRPAAQPRIRTESCRPRASRLAPCVERAPACWDACPEHTRLPLLGLVWGIPIPSVAIVVAFPLARGLRKWAAWFKMRCALPFP